MHKCDELNEFGHGLLHKAVIHNKTEEFFELLLEGHDLSQKDELGFSPIHVASLLGRDVILEKLLTFKERYFSEYPNKATAMSDQNCVNALSNDGHTALHLASKIGNSEILSLLLKIGCDKNIVDANGRTALDFAKKYNHHQCVNILEGKDSVYKDTSKNRIARNPYKIMKKKLMQIKRKIIAKSFQDDIQSVDILSNDPNEINEKAENCSSNELESSNRCFRNNVSFESNKTAFFITDAQLRGTKNRQIDIARTCELSDLKHDSIKNSEHLATTKKFNRQNQVDTRKSNDKQDIVSHGCCNDDGCHTRNDEEADSVEDEKQHNNNDLSHLDYQIKGSIHKVPSDACESHSETCTNHLHTVNNKCTPHPTILHIHDNNSASRSLEEGEKFCSCRKCFYRLKGEEDEISDQLRSRNNDVLLLNSCNGYGVDTPENDQCRNKDDTRNDVSSSYSHGLIVDDLLFKKKSFEEDVIRQIQLKSLSDSELCDYLYSRNTFCIKCREREGTVEDCFNYNRGYRGFSSTMGLNQSSDYDKGNETTNNNDCWEVWDLRQCEITSRSLNACFSPQREISHKKISHSMPNMVFQVQCVVNDENQTANVVCKASSCPNHLDYNNSFSIHDTKVASSELFDDFTSCCVIGEENEKNGVEKPFSHKNTSSSSKYSCIDMNTLPSPSHQFFDNFYEDDENDEFYQTGSCFSPTKEKPGLPVMFCEKIYNRHSDSDIPSLFSNESRKLFCNENTFSQSLPNLDDCKYPSNLNDLPGYINTSSLCSHQCYDWGLCMESYSNVRARNHFAAAKNRNHVSIGSPLVHSYIDSDQNELESPFTCFNCGSEVPKVSSHQVRKLDRVKFDDDEFVLISYPSRKSSESTLTDDRLVRNDAGSSALFSSKRIQQNRDDCFDRSSLPVCLCQLHNRNEEGLDVSTAHSPIKRVNLLDTPSIKNATKDGIACCEQMKQNEPTIDEKMNVSLSKPQHNSSKHHQSVENIKAEAVNDKDEQIHRQNTNIEQVPESFDLLDALEISTEEDSIKNAIKVATWQSEQEIKQILDVECKEMPYNTSKCLQGKVKGYEDKLFVASQCDATVLPSQMEMNTSQINNCIKEKCINNVGSGDGSLKANENLTIDGMNQENDISVVSNHKNHEAKICKIQEERVNGRLDIAKVNKDSSRETNINSNDLISSKYNASNSRYNDADDIFISQKKDSFESMQDNIDLISNDTGIEMENDDLSITDFDDISCALDVSVLSNEGGRFQQKETKHANGSELKILQNTIYSPNHTKHEEAMDAFIVNNFADDMNVISSEAFEEASYDCPLQTIPIINPNTLKTASIPIIDKKKEYTVENNNCVDISNQGAKLNFTGPMPCTIRSRNDQRKENSHFIFKPKADNNNNDDNVHLDTSTTENANYLDVNHGILSYLLNFSRNLITEARPLAETISLIARESETKMTVGIMFLNCKSDVENEKPSEHNSHEGASNTGQVPSVLIIEASKSSKSIKKSSNSNRNGIFKITSCFAFHGWKPMQLKDFWFLRDPRIVALLVIKISENDAMKFCRKEIVNYICRKVVEKSFCSFDLVINWFLVLLSLIKDEDNSITRPQTNLSSILPVLENMIKKSYFKLAHARQLAVFLARKNEILKSHRKYRINFLLTFFKLELKDSPFSCRYPFKIFSKILMLFKNIDEDFEIAYEVLDRYLSMYLHRNNCLEFISDVLIYLGLLKSEFPVDITDDVQTCLTFLNHIVVKDYFPPGCIAYIRAFLQTKNDSLMKYKKEQSELLYTLEIISNNNFNN